MSLFDELRRRKVFKVGATYLVVAWLAVQAASIGFPAFDAPSWALRIFILLALLGFPFTIVMAWVFESTPEGVQIDSGRKGSKGLVAVAAGLVVLALAWYFQGQASLRPGEPVVARTTAAASADTSRESAPTGTSINPKSIAVLAFADLSPGKDQEYFSDGMAEEILNALAQVKDLKVAGRTSAFFYKGRNVDLREIGKQLGVAHVLEGSVRTQGKRVRITAQLIQASDGTHLWSKTFDGDLQDVFKLQESVARAITDELEIVLQEGQQLVPVATRSPEAYALYLKATSTFDRRDGANMAHAAKQLEQAIALDPEYARAYSRLAAVYFVLPNYTGEDPARAQPKLRATAKRATELDPSLAEPWAVLGMEATQGEADYIVARQYFEAAMRLDPDDITTNFWYGLHLMRTGYRRAGIARIEHALAVDPMVPNVMRWRGIAYLREGNVDGAEHLLKRAYAAGLKLAGRELGEIAGQRGEDEQAKRLWQEGSYALLRSLPGDSAKTLADGMFGGAAERDRATTLLEAYAAEHERVSGLVPMVLALMGRGARAMAIEAERVRGDNVDFCVYMFSPAGAAMRALPEHQAWVRAKGLPALWAKHGPPDTQL